MGRLGEIRVSLYIYVGVVSCGGPVFRWAVVVFRWVALFVSCVEIVA
jgi:hypothetical protein